MFLCALQAVRIMALADFPSKWPDLLQRIVAKMNSAGNDPNTIIGVLKTAHEIFKQFRGIRGCVCIFSVQEFGFGGGNAVQVLSSDLFHVFLVSFLLSFLLACFSLETAAFTRSFVV